MLSAQREGVRGSVVGEGEACESQELINAQRTAFTAGRGRAASESCRLGCGSAIWQQLGWGWGVWTPPRLGLRKGRGRTFGGKDKETGFREFCNGILGLRVKGA